MLADHLYRLVVGTALSTAVRHRVEPKRAALCSNQLVGTASGLLSDRREFRNSLQRESGRISLPREMRSAHPLPLKKISRLKAATNSQSSIYLGTARRRRIIEACSTWQMSSASVTNAPKILPIIHMRPNRTAVAFALVPRPVFPFRKAAARYAVHHATSKAA